MNLSKVYSTQETFEPEDIVRAKLKGPMIFGTIMADKLRNEEQQSNDFKPSPPAKKIEDEENQDSSEKREQQTAAAPAMPENKNPALGEAVAEPAPAQVKKAPVAPPPPPPPPPLPGVPVEEVEQMVAESYQRGLQEGMQQAEADFGSATKSLLLICQQLDTLRETILQNSVGEMRDLVLVIAEKIIRHSVQDQNSTIVETVEEAIHKAVRSDEFYIYVNPDDFETVASRSEELISGLNGLNNIVVKRDRSVERGGCRIESENCTVDATLASQLEIVGNHLKQRN